MSGVDMNRSGATIAPNNAFNLGAHVQIVDGLPHVFNDARELAVGNVEVGNARAVVLQQLRPGIGLVSTFSAEDARKVAAWLVAEATALEADAALAATDILRKAADRLGATPPTPSTGRLPLQRTARRVERAVRGSIIPAVRGALDILCSRQVAEALVFMAVCFALGFAWGAPS